MTEPAPQSPPEPDPADERAPVATPEASGGSPVHDGDTDEVLRERVPWAVRLEHAVDVVAICLLLVVPFLAWWATGRWTTWGTLERLGASAGAGVLAALVPIFLTTYLVTLRRGYREVDADLSERWPEYRTGRRGRRRR